MRRSAGPTLAAVGTGGIARSEDESDLQHRTPNWRPHATSRALRRSGLAIRALNAEASSPRRRRARRAERRLANWPRSLARRPPRIAFDTGDDWPGTGDRPHARARPFTGTRKRGTRCCGARPLALGSGDATRTRAGPARADPGATRSRRAQLLLRRPRHPCPALATARQTPSDRARTSQRPHTAAPQSTGRRLDRIRRRARTNTSSAAARVATHSAGTRHRGRNDTARSRERKGNETKIITQKKKETRLR